MSDSRSDFRFNPEWRITLFTVLMLPALCGLGVWQLQRADEKAALALAFAQQQSMPPAPLAELQGKPDKELAYRPALLNGEYVEGAYFLLDNRTRNGRFGYEVLHIVRTNDGAAALVNRGWVRGDASRQSLPALEPLSGRFEMTGHVYVAPGKPYLLAPQVLTDGWPKRIQAVEMALLAPAVQDTVDATVFPYPIRLDANQPGALDIDWQFINVSPAKHTGYAVQWFSMAAVLALVYLFQASNLWQMLRGKQENGASDE
ncbi:MAG: SURF1 family protein [Halioglobus sp.]